LSHLRWDFVFQRPQHLLSRLSKSHPVYFIEEPQFTWGAPRLEKRCPAANLMVCQPYTSVQQPGFHDDHMPSLKPLIQQLLVEEAVGDQAAWSYTPMPLPL